MASETPFEFYGYSVSFDPLVHRGTIHVHPDDWQELQGRLYCLDGPVTQDDRDQQDAAAFAQEPEERVPEDRS